MIKNLLLVMNGATLTLPALELSILLAGLSCCLVFRFTRTGLLIAYMFIYRWGWLILADAGQSLLVGYLVFGMLIGIATVIGLMRTSSDR